MTGGSSFTRVTPRALRGASALPLAALILTMLMLALQTPTHAAAEDALVTTNGGCLRLRAEPSLNSTVVTCLAEGSTVDALDESAEADGHLWRRVTVSGPDARERGGWVASTYLSSQAPTAELPAELPAVLPIPPVGGLTLGRAGTSSIEILLAAQHFEVASAFVLDVESQQFEVYSPALGVLNGTFALDPDDIVLVRRGASDTTGQVAGTPVAFVGMDGPGQLSVPPRGGLAAGIAGTDDMSALIANQRFTVDLVMVWDIETQQWTMYRPGAPAFTNTLASLTPSTPIFLRRDPVAPDPDPPPPPQAAEPPEPPPPPAGAMEPGSMERGEERVTYYYCERGTNPAWWGDGGSWCGAMANGEPAHEGAASCARHLMGQQFVIVGDPLERVYTCKDTGGGVTEGHRDIWFRDSDTARLWWDEVGPVAVVIPIEG